MTRRILDFKKMICEAHQFVTEKEEFLNRHINVVSLGTFALTCVFNKTRMPNSNSSKPQ